MVIARAGLVIEVSQPLSEIIQNHRFSAHRLYGKKTEITSNAGVNTGLSGSKANLQMVIIIIIIIVIITVIIIIIIIYYYQLLLYIIIVVIIIYIYTYI